MAGPAGVAHLPVASSSPLRYGTATPAALAARAASLGMSALALTDRDGLYGAFKHVQACADAGIKALLGADLALLPPAGPPSPMSRRPRPARRPDWHPGRARPTYKTRTPTRPAVLRPPPAGTELAAPPFSPPNR